MVFSLVENSKSIDKIMELVTAEVAKGLAERKAGKDKQKADAATKDAAAKVAETKKAEKPTEKVEATEEEAKSESK